MDDTFELFIDFIVIVIIRAKGFIPPTGFTARKALTNPCLRLMCKKVTMKVFNIVG